MVTQDGFILGIYNYCDRWCETCRLTSRCRLFADLAKNDAERDVTLAPVVKAPPLPQEVRDTPQWIKELIDLMNEAAASGEDVSEKEMPLAHRAIEERAGDYSARVHEWLRAQEPCDLRDTEDPRATIAWFGFFIATKTYRALMGLANDDGDDGLPADHDGSAKAAILGIERSHVAWLELVRRRSVSAAEAEPFIADLVSVGEQLERIFPKARSFVRPGFDEPDEVARLEAAER